MARRAPYVDPAEKARIDNIRQSYYQKLQTGELKLPKHNDFPEERVSPPTPDEKARMNRGQAAKPAPIQFNPEGGLVIPEELRGDVEQVEIPADKPRGNTEPGQISRGSLVEDDDTVDEQARVQREIKELAEQLDPRDAVDIGDTWEEQPWDQLRALAKNFAEGVPVTNKEQAKEIIRAEIERRNTE